MTDVIKFFDNPWPDGHRIETFVWHGELRRDGIWFHFHLETENYYQQDRDDEEDDLEGPGSDWQAKIVWNNYHACTLSSSEWSEGGFKVADHENKLDLSQLDQRSFHVDPPELFYEPDREEAFRIYLLGHDAAADHHITFTRNDGKSYRIHWQGRIARLYVGEEEFRYRFETTIHEASLEEIAVSDELDHLSKEETIQHFAGFITNPRGYRYTGWAFVKKSNPT